MDSQPGIYQEIPSRADMEGKQQQQQTKPER
jgi:hypothetical protein